jgi:protein-S-isoprenylcysteine O-methyltransferase Ste14
MRAGLSPPFEVTIYCWFALELLLVVRDVITRRARLEHDRGTRGVVALTLAGAIIAGVAVRTWLPALHTPVPAVFEVAGLVVVWLGLALRIWAVVTLGRSFSTFIQVESGQTVVTRGPYQWVRHPSYTGLLLIAVGFGLGAANWLSLVICAVVPLLGLLPRIAVEESELAGTLGEQYRSYQRTTRRLVPGVW